MTIEKSPMGGLFVVVPQVFEDERGCFFESWNSEKFGRLGIDVNFVQDNQSLSQKGILRGLHFQRPPFAQGKLVRVIKGSVWDVVVDLRQHSPTCGKCYCIELNEANKKMLWIPEGFAHGFATLQDDTIFSYKCTEVYAPEYEKCIIWNDKTLNIDWKIANPILSEKDSKGDSFENFTHLFKM